MSYIKDSRGKYKRRTNNLTEYIRHQIHHPENKNNTRYSDEQLGESINLMRVFIGTSTIIKYEIHRRTIGTSSC